MPCCQQRMGRIAATAKGTSSLLCIAGTLLALEANVLLAAYTDYTAILCPRDGRH